MYALRRTALGALLGWAALAPQVADAAGAVELLLSDSGGAYQEVADVLRRELTGIAEVTQRVAGDKGKPPATEAAVAVAVGARACAVLAQTSVAGVRRVCTLVPKATMTGLAASAPGSDTPVHAVLLDQPLHRQLALVRLAMPERSRVAVIRGNGVDDAAQLQAAAIGAGIRLQTGRVESAEDLGDALRLTLRGAQVLLAMPDTDVYNGGTIQNILRTTFRERVPLVAFSPAYVRAGATLAVYSTPAQIARQTAHTVRALLSGQATPLRQYPQEFEIATNPQVARALGIALDDADSLARDLRRMEGGR